MREEWEGKWRRRVGEKAECVRRGKRGWRGEPNREGEEGGVR